MLTLTEFLLARVAEDEAVAQKKAGTLLALNSPERPVQMVDSPFSPSRVLAECEAKRRIVELHKDGGWSQGYADDGYGGHEHACASCGAFGEYGVPYPCATLRALALPYADQPDYREEWKP